MKKTLIFLLFYLLLFKPLGLAQSDSTFRTDFLLDEIDNLENTDEDSYISEELMEELHELTNTKPNLNDLSYDVAVRILHLSDYQYYQLQLYIENYGQLASIYELDAINGFSPSDRERISALAKVIMTTERQPFFKNFFKKSKQTLLVRYGQILEHQAGYDTSRATHYAGDPSHVCFKYDFSTQNKFFIKLSGEKDAGEQFFRGKQKYGFDFYSGSISIKDIGILKNAVIGDYRINFGQGLVLGTSLLSGKGSGPDDIRRFSTGIRAIAPTNESDFLRGGAVTLGKSHWSGTLFGGRTFGSTNNTFGGDLSYRRALFKIGIRFACYTSTDTSSQNFADKVRRSLIPIGWNIGTDYQVIVRKHLLWGELAFNENGHLGILQSALINLSPILKLATVFRFYDKDYSSPLGHAFGTKSGNSGEVGLYLTTALIASRNLEIMFYADYYRLTWLSYRTDAPVVGMDAGLSAQYNISRYSKLLCKYSFRSKSQNANNNDYYKEIAETQRHKIRIQWHNTPYDFLTLKTEIDGQLNHDISTGKNKWGVLLYQDAAFEMKRIGLSIHSRVAYFDTDSYDERQYAYEDDVYYAFTIGSYYYKGVRGYLVLRYKYRFFSLWLRLSQTYYIDRQKISSGLSEIDKPHKTELKLQLLFSL